MKNDIYYLKHIIDSIVEIENYSKENRDSMLTRRAIERCIEIIGEAVNNLSKDFQTKYTSVPWKDISGTRNKLIHDYMGVDENIIWYIVNDNIPLLKKQILAILEQKEEI